MTKNTIKTDVGNTTLTLRKSRISVERLPYHQTGIKRFMNPETINIHYDKYYRANVDKLNLEINKSKISGLDLEQIVITINNYDDTVKNAALCVYNHDLFWKQLSPTNQKQIGVVIQKIESEFGSLKEFKRRFALAARTIIGSGWVWLVLTKESKLKIITTQNNDNPLTLDDNSGGYPLLCLDMWEHAYFLKYKNSRNDYIKNFWPAVNWRFVDSRYLSKINSKLDDTIIAKQIVNSTNSDPSSDLFETKQFCMPRAERKFKQLLFPSSDLLKKSELYGKFKREYTNGWISILKKVYPEYWKEKNELFNGHESGIYDKNKVRPVLMNLTSSYSAFCVIFNEINAYLRKTNQKEIKFGYNPGKNISELMRFFSVLDGLRSAIFSREKESALLKKVIPILKKTECLGKRNEDAASKIIKQNLGEKSCRLVSGSGKTNDMMSGIDAIITIKGKKHTAQIKPFKAVISDATQIRVKGSSSTQEYSKIDLIAFINIKSKSVRLYKTKNITVHRGEYVIPKENELMILFAISDLELIDCNKYLS